MKKECLGEVSSADSRHFGPKAKYLNIFLIFRYQLNYFLLKHLGISIGLDFYCLNILSLFGSGGKNE